MPTSPPALAVLWDEAHLWGLLIHRALQSLGIVNTVLRAADIKKNALPHGLQTLLVPGGWASRKARALGPEGLRHIRAFVHQGGQYVGICGGAGLALQGAHPDQLLNLCPWTRKKAAQRLPNFSGHLFCQVAGSTQPVALPVWWPSQFQPTNKDAVQIVARYESPAADFWSADLCWQQIPAEEASVWEALYGINLHPKRLRGEPCIIQGTFGHGTYTLSYAHLETPESPEANALLGNILKHPGNTVPDWDLQNLAPLWENTQLFQMYALLHELIQFGTEHFLLIWRTSWLLGWRRGIPGSALGTLLAMIWQSLHTKPTSRALTFWQEKGTSTSVLCARFCQETRRYFLHERCALTKSLSSPEKSASEHLQKHKECLFGTFPGYGGWYGELLEVLDQLLWLQTDSLKKT